MSRSITVSRIVDDYHLNRLQSMSGITEEDDFVLGIRSRFDSLNDKDRQRFSIDLENLLDSQNSSSELDPAFEGGF